MTLELLLAGVLALGAVPATPPPDAKAPESLEPLRTPLEALTERAIGATSRPVRFDWRKTTVGFGVTGAQVLEFNTFWSESTALVVRHPLGGLMGSLAVAYVGTYSTDGSRKLSLTPYRQFGRPSRFELQFDLGLPLAEGIATLWPKYLPATEFVVSATAGARYLLYLESFQGVQWKDAPGFFAPTLWQRDQDRLLDTRPAGMQVDPARYSVLVGLTTDLYTQSGFFVTFRMLLGLPLPLPGSNLGFWWEPSLTLGWAF